MKVLHVEAGRHLYGGAAQVLMLLNGLRELQLPGEHLLACAPGSAIAVAAEQQGLAAALRPLPLGGELDVLAGWRLSTLLRREQCQLLHVHSRRGVDWWGAPAAALAQRPAVLSRRVDNPENWLTRRKYCGYRRVITISAEIRRLLIERERLAPEQVVCVPSAVDTKRFRPGGERAWLAAEFGLDESHLLLGVAAQLIARKGHDILLDALPAILAQHPQARLLLFGRGPRDQALRRRSVELGLQQQVVFAGLRDDMQRILPSLDLLIHPALMEGLGVALLEAAACAVPIVASAVGGIPEIVRDGVNGRLVPPGDAKALAYATSQLLADPATAARLGQRGRELVLREFSIARMARDNHRVYQQLLGETT